MLYIMRHGKTDWNLKHKLQGRTDIPLNDIGRQMAREACELYKDVHFDICYCSPLERARETADLVLAGRDVPIVYDDRLVELGFGIYEGEEEVFEKYDCPARELFFNPARYVAQDGAESLDELFARTGEFLEEIVISQVKAGKDVLILGHGAMNSAIICRVRNLPREDFWAEDIANCRLIKLM